MSLLTSSLRLSSRVWQSSLAMRWAQSAFWSVQDWFAADEGKKRAATCKLEVEPLEVRRMPAFALALFSDAAPDPIQGSFSGVGRSVVGLHDGNLMMGLPIDFFRSQPGAHRNDPVYGAALVYNSNTVDVKPILQFQLTSDGGDPIPTSIDARLTFNSTANAMVTYSTSGHSGQEMGSGLGQVRFT